MVTAQPVSRPAIPAWRPYLRAIVPLSLLVVVAVALRPDLRPIAEASTAIKVHLAAAVSCLFLGAVMMAGRKGARFHRTAGWVWVTVMAVLVISSFFVRTLNPGHFSWIHLISGGTAVSLPVAVLAAKRHKVRTHSRTMMGMFYGGLIIAGIFTFVPGRVLYQAFFGG